MAEIPAKEAQKRSQHVPGSVQERSQRAQEARSGMRLYYPTASHGIAQWAPAMPAEPKAQQPITLEKTMIAFAKLIFVAAAALSAGSEMSWPHMPQVGGENLSSVILPTFSPQHPTVGTQRLCLLAPGVYIITARVGFKPLARGTPEVNGQLWLKGGAGGELYLAPLYASAERWNVDGATHQFVAPPGGVCYSLRYDLDGPATVNEDPRATYIAVTYLGAIAD